MFCQIARCLAHAQRFGRQVVVDTDHHMGSIRDRFSNYFSSVQPNLVLDVKGAPTLSFNAPCLPRFISGRVNDYDLTYSDDLGTYVESLTGKPIKFNFDKDQRAPLLVHHRGGGGTGSLDALKFLRITPLVAAHMARRMSTLSDRYCGIHIRATDYQTNYEIGLRQISAGLSGPVFVATDNIAALEYAQSVLAAHQTFSFTQLTAAGGKPLHQLQLTDPSSVLQNNLDSLADLLMLALAKNVYSFEIIGQQGKSKHPKYSGYSRLAANLHRSGDALRALLGSHDDLDRQLERLDISPGFPRSPPPGPLDGILAS